MSDVDGVLVELAAAFGVATEYWDWQGHHVRVSADTLTAVLEALGADTSTEQSRAAALDGRRTEAWRRLLPPYVVAREGTKRTVEVHVDHGASVEVWIVREDGSFHSKLTQVDDWQPPREIDGRLVGEASFQIPDDLPAGYHSVLASSGAEQAEGELIVAPAWLGVPARLGARKVWGLAAQLYSVRSHRSWGVGDLTDLGELAGWAAAEHDAAFVLINPLHAAEPVPPMEPSPYLPTTRRFANPLYLRVERIPEYAYLDETAREQIDRLAASARGNVDVIDRDRAWRAKRAALSIVHAQGLEPGREIAYRAFCRREGKALDDFATWCALSEAHGAGLARLARTVAAPARRRGERVRGRQRQKRRLLPLAAVDSGRATRRIAGHGPSGRYAARHRARPGRRGEPDRRGLVGLAGRDGPAHHGRRTARSVRPDRPGLEPAAVAAGPARRVGVRALP